MAGIFSKGLQCPEDPRKVNPDEKGGRIIDERLILARLHVIAFDELIGALPGNTVPGPLIELQVQDVQDPAGDNRRGREVGVRVEILMVFLPDLSQIVVVVHDLVEGHACRLHGEEPRRRTYRHTIRGIFQPDGIPDPGDSLPVSPFGLFVLKGDIVTRQPGIEMLLLPPIGIMCNLCPPFLHFISPAASYRTSPVMKLFYLVTMLAFLMTSPQRISPSRYFRVFSAFRKSVSKARSLTFCRNEAS